VEAALKNSVTEIDEDIFAFLVCINRPSFNPHANVAHEEVLEIDATTPGVIGLDVPVVYPIMSHEGIRAPKRDVKLSVRVPFRTRRRSYLFHFLPRILSSGKRGRSERACPQQAQQQFFHLFLLLVKFSL